MLDSAGLRVALAVTAAGSLATQVVTDTEASQTVRVSLLAVNVLAVAALAALEAARGPRLGRTVLMVLGGVLLVIAVVRPPARSNDLWAYAFYGRIIVEHDGDPFVDVPSDFPDDPLYGRVDERWRDDPSLYGPVWTVGSAALAVVVTDHPLPTRLAYQGLAALAAFGVLVLVDRRTKSAAATALVALNPAVVLFTVNAGHSDALVGLGIAAAVLLVQARRATTAGVVLGLAAMVKIVAGLAVLPLVWWAWRNRRSSDGIRVAVTAAGLTAAGYALVGRGAAIDALRQGAKGSNWTSVWRWMLYRAAEHGDRMDLADRWAGRMTAVVAVAVVLAIVTRLRQRSAVPAVVAAFLVYLLVAPHSLVWYVMWVLPLAALRWRSRLSVTLGVWTAVVLVAGELPHPDGLAPNWLYWASLLGVAVVLLAPDHKYSPVLPSSKRRAATA